MKKLPKIINQEEFELLLKNAGKHCRQISPTRLKQYKLAMLLGFESGMRISEIVGFKPSGAEIWRVPPLEKEQVSDSSIKIISGKGGKDRIVSRPKRMNIKKISNWIFIIGMLFLIAGMICQVVGL